VRNVTDINAEVWVSPNHRPMGFAESVVVIDSIMALNPLAMDMMLPALPDIASAFDITIANKPQAVLSTFLMGLGVDQFIMGPLSDRLAGAPS
jgi:DHA1 family bicyclomycin/chloramphenicol resistance-like MFS transporter